MTGRDGEGSPPGDCKRLYDLEITKLYDEFAAQVYRCARRGLGHEDAEEIVNASFMAARRHWERVRAYAFPIAYVMKTASNLRADALARAARRQTVSLDDPSILEPWLLWTSVDEDVSRLHEALARLSPREEQVTVFYYWTGLPTRDIAEVLGVSVGHVSRTLSDARARLRRLLSDPDGEKESGADDE
jgi:RNA polymerase sigma factor (sigma-70 family)